MRPMTKPFGNRRHLPEGLCHRPHRLCRARRGGLPPDPDPTGRRFHQPGRSACRADAAGPGHHAGFTGACEHAAMKTLAVVVALALAVVLQTKLAPFLVLGTSPLDLVLIVVVYVAITSGPTTGLLAGAAAGLAQDAL